MPQPCAGAGGISSGPAHWRALLRPNGWLLVAVALSYWAWHGPRRRTVRLAGLGGIGLTFVAAVVILITLRPGLLTNDPQVMLRQGEVIWGYREGRLAMPDDPGATRAGLPGAAEYALYHPGACMRLAVLRVFTELVHARPYYSMRHNAVIVAVLAPLYLLALVGFVRNWRRPLAGLLVSVIVSHLLVQAVNYADWSGRFLLYVLPLIGVLAASGFVSISGALKARFASGRMAPARCESSDASSVANGMGAVAPATKGQVKAPAEPPAPERTDFIKHHMAEALFS